MRPHVFHPSILREYDIRGVYGETLFEADARAIGARFGAILSEAAIAASQEPRVVVGRDGRLSSPDLEAALVEGFVEAGVTVVRIGLGPTPMLYFAEASTPEVQGGVQVTGSHNPRDHNGFKMVLGGRPFFGADIRRLEAMDDALVPRSPGRIEQRDVLPTYVDWLLKGLCGIDPHDLGSLRVGWDAGNGAAGPALEMLVSRLPGEHHLLHSEVDGRFPNHHPDPTIEANLADLQALVAAKKLDFGAAFDGDADRLGIVDGRGRVVDADGLLMVFARDVLARRPGATVIADAKASAAVFDTVRELGGTAQMAPSGHSHIKSRMKATGALLGGETSGHFFFADDAFGFDDGLYAAVRLIAACARLNRSVAQLRDTMPVMHNTPELRFAAPEDRKFAVVEEVRERLAATGLRVNALDGVRVETGEGWWLLRASNTQAALTARAESVTTDGLARLVAEIDRQLALSGVKRAGDGKVGHG